MTIYRYFAMRFLRSFLATLAAFMVLSVMIETVEQLRRFASDSMSFATGFGLSLLAVPRNLYDILPWWYSWQRSSCICRWPGPAS